MNKHWPTIPVYGDLKELAYEPKKIKEEFDLICGGIPCQPFSLAGEQKGKEDDRHLWPFMFEIIKKKNQLGSLSKMLVASSMWHSTMCALTWKPKVTPHNRLLFQLVPSKLPTEEIESGFLQKEMWPTPTAHIAKEGAYPAEFKRKTPTLAAEVQMRMWPTPQASDNRDRGHLGSGAVQRRLEKGKQIMLSQSVSTTLVH